MQSYLLLNQCVIGAKKSRLRLPIMSRLLLLSLILLYGVGCCYLLVCRVIRLGVQGLRMRVVRSLKGRVIGE